MRQRQQELRPARMAERRPLVAERQHLEPRGVDDRLVLVRVHRADRVDDRAAGPHALGRRAQQLELQLRAAAAPATAGRAARASTPSPEQGASTSARSKPSLGGSSRASATTTRTSSRPSRRRFSLELARAALVQLDRDDLVAVRASRSCRRARRSSRARVRLRADRERRELRRTAHAGTRAPPRRRARPPARRAARRGRRSAHRDSSPRKTRTTVSGGSFCARISASASSRPRSRSQTSAIQSG